MELRILFMPLCRKPLLEAALRGVLSMENTMDCLRSAGLGGWRLLEELKRPPLGVRGRGKQLVAILLASGVSGSWSLAERLSDRLLPLRLCVFWLFRVLLALGLGGISERRCEP